jgi:hypothetical protein
MALSEPLSRLLLVLSILLTVALLLRFGDVRRRRLGGSGLVVAATWSFFSLYALWNVVGLLVFLASTVVVLEALPRAERRYDLPDRTSVIVAMLVGAVVSIFVLVVDGVVPQTVFVFDGIAAVGGILSGVAGYSLLHSEERPVLTTFTSLVALPVFYLALLWFWLTPPCATCELLGVSPAAYAPMHSLIVDSDANAFLQLWTGLNLPILQFIAVTATGIGTLVFIYVVSSMIGHIFYSSQKGVEKVEDLTVVLVTIASEDVREALYESIEHNRALLNEYDFYVLIDEGADLQSELEDMDVDLAVVPDSFEAEAIAKGRAMQYFVEEYVEEDEWYAFIDDDNLVQGREFLYEIPAQEADGKLVMNSLLIPRRGGSTIAFAIDHMRTLFDFTFFRTCTGLLGRPYAGLHGELLCARGDVLRTVGFDKPSIVEDFVFANELIKRGIPTWQSQTATSILSPHSLEAYFTQRSRWFIGKVSWLPRCSPGTMIVTGLIQGVWFLGIFGGWLVGGIWLLFGPPIQSTYLMPPVFSSIVYSSIYSIGVLRMGLRHLPKILLIPIYATIEHAAPYISLLRNPDEFEVIKK